MFPTTGTTSDKEKDAVKVVVYITTMKSVRETYMNCRRVVQILRNFLINPEVRDVLENDYRNEIRELMRFDNVVVPQVFVNGQHIGDVETIERLNDSGELRQILKPYEVHIGNVT